VPDGRTNGLQISDFSRGLWEAMGMPTMRSSTAEDLRGRVQTAPRRSVQRKPERRPAPRLSRGLSRWDKVSIALSFALCTGMLWFLGAQAAAVLRLNDEIASLQQQIRTVQADNAALAEKVDELSQPSRILDIALNKLHMRYAQPIAIPASNASH
jgi:cell division protein FtsL